MSSSTSVVSNVSTSSRIPFSDRNLHTGPDILTHIPLLLSIPPTPDALITITAIPGGITNTIYKLTLSPNPPVLVRLYGSPAIFPPSARRRETLLFAQLSNAGLAPTLLATFGNGRVEDFLDASPIDLPLMTDVSIGVNVARKLAALHAFRPKGYYESPPDVSPIWHDMRQWAKTATTLTSQKTHATVEETRAATAIHAHDINVDRAVSLLSKFHAMLSRTDPKNPLVFSHNDLLAGNILLHHSTNATDTTKKISLIDFEYAGWNARPFDIGNYFAECMGGTQDGTVRTELYPPISFRRQFCTAYLTHANRARIAPTEAEVERLLADADRYECVSHMYWGLWALVQSVSSQVDFPYIRFAQQRLKLLFEKSTSMFR